jgi:hypothetical protein
MENHTNNQVRTWKNKGNFIIELPDRLMHDCLGNDFNGKHTYSISVEKDCFIIQKQGQHGCGSKETILIYSSGTVKVIKPENYKPKTKNGGDI